MTGLVFPLVHNARKGRSVYTAWARMAAAGMGLLLVSGCTTGKGADGGTTTTGGGANSNGTGSKAAGNMLRYPLISEPTTLDPAKVEDGTTIDLLQNVFEGLVRWDEQNNIAPSLAEKWELSPDGTTYTFHLRHGVKFQKNGRELTADDFKYSFERACDPALASPTAPVYLADIKGVNQRLNFKTGTGTPPPIDGVKVVDPYTLQITLTGFKPYWLGNMTYLCSYAVCKEEIEKTSGKVDETSGLGTGPFQFKSYVKGTSVTLDANPAYYAGKPKLDGIFRPIMTDGGTRLSSYEAGELDFVDVSPRDLDHINSDPNLKNDLKTFPRAATWYVALNQDSTDSPFKKKEVRQAFAHAIDPEAVVRVALKGQADLATGIVPPHLGDYVSTCKPLKFDVAEAKKLLASGGLPGRQGLPQNAPHVPQRHAASAKHVRSDRAAVKGKPQYRGAGAADALVRLFEGAYGQNHAPFPSALGRGLRRPAKLFVRPAALQ